MFQWPRRLWSVLATVACLLFWAAAAHAQVVRLGDLNTTQIRALDRSRTVVLLTGGMLEEHGPYLPAFTDGILSERLTAELAGALVARKPGWTALLMPPVSFGASGYNEIGGHVTFPGTYAVRPSTLRAAFMDMASELGDQGFRHLFVVHVHGSPLHIRALDQAGDFFHATYGGHMVNLWGLMPVLDGWGKAIFGLSAAVKAEEGASLHGGMDEHSLMLHLRPELVAPGYKTAPRVTGATTAESIEIARRPDWPGYLGSPKLATAAFGAVIWKGLADAAIQHLLLIVSGTDPVKFPRYGDYLYNNPLFQPWITAAELRDTEREMRQRAWLAGRR